MSTVEIDQTHGVKLTADPQELEHRRLRRDEFWRSVPAYEKVESSIFHSHTFQTRNSITSLKKLRQAVKNLVPEDFMGDVSEGLRRAPMSLRISPYVLSLINWDDPYVDPLVRQFLPLASQQLPDHPELRFDSLNEQVDSPVPGLTHRYPDRALFLALDTCPVYCRFCTRSYAVGLDTEEVEKVRMNADRRRWEETFSYIASRPELEDIVVSGGDVYNLKADQLQYIGESLLNIEHIRRFRFATKGPAVMPGKFLTDTEWVDALIRIAEMGRRMHKEVVVHTHFNHPAEITGITQDAMNVLVERGITVRNQTVLQRGVNDDSETMKLLAKRLGYINVQPYYVFFHDLVQGVEDLRTTLGSGLELEKELRGVTAGFNTPIFIVDTLDGGGKRDAHSFEVYNKENGIAVFKSPPIRPGAYFLYFDPIDCLSEEAQERWMDPVSRKQMIDEVLEMARKEAS